MKLTWKRLFIGCGIVLVLFIAAGVLGYRTLKSFLYPPTPPMPASVETPTLELLRAIETELREHAPTIAQTLQPGLSDAEINSLEAKGNFKLADDLRSFYRWHNGASTNVFETFPGHHFAMLQTVVEEHNGIASGLQSVPSMQRATYGLFTGHRATWFMILPDGAGDGFAFDPARRESEGAFFNHFSETAEYFYFPSFRNYLAATLECFKEGAYRSTKDGIGFDEDPDKVTAIWKKYGASPPDDR